MPDETSDGRRVAPIAVTAGRLGPYRICVAASQRKDADRHPVAGDDSHSAPIT